MCPSKSTEFVDLKSRKICILVSIGIENINLDQNRTTMITGLYHLTKGQGRRNGKRAGWAKFKKSLGLFFSRPTLGPPRGKGKVGLAHPGPPRSGVPGETPMCRCCGVLEMLESELTGVDCIFFK